MHDPHSTRSHKNKEPETDYIIPTTLNEENEY